MLVILKRAAAYLFAVVVLLADALDAVFGPLLRPTLRHLASLRIFRRIGDAIAALPPYVVLALLAVPFAAIEPFKFVGLYWIAEGRLLVGAATLAAAHLLSFFVCERIFHAGRQPLLTIGWFSRGYDAVMDVRARTLAWVRSTAAWRGAAELAGAIRQRVVQAFSASRRRG